jgi:hypothetical protein
MKTRLRARVFDARQMKAAIGADVPNRMLNVYSAFLRLLPPNFWRKI